jgi:hypothetical protein
VVDPETNGVSVKSLTCVQEVNDWNADQVTGWPDRFSVVFLSSEANAGIRIIFTLKSSIFWVATPYSLEEVHLRSSETSVNFFRTTRRHIPEDITLRSHHCENHKSDTS